AQVPGGHEDRGHRGRDGQDGRRGEAAHPPRCDPPARRGHEPEAGGMSSYHDPELDDVLQDEELRRLASMVMSARRPEPPVDDAFRTGLRRQLMQEAWAISEGGDAWWRRLFAPPGLAWAGAITGLLLIAAIVVWQAGAPTGALTQVVAPSNLDGRSSVPLAQPIYFNFTQPMNHQTTEAAVQILP